MSDQVNLRPLALADLAEPALQLACRDGEAATRAARTGGPEFHVLPDRLDAGIAREHLEGTILDLVDLASQPALVRSRRHHQPVDRGLQNVSGRFQQAGLP